MILDFFQWVKHNFEKLSCLKFLRLNKIISSSPCLNYLYIVSFEVGIILIKALFSEVFLNNLYTKLKNFINGCKLVRANKGPELEICRKYRRNHTKQCAVHYLQKASICMIY